MIIDADYDIKIPDITQVLWNGKGKLTPAEPLPSDRVAMLRSCISGQSHGDLSSFVMRKLDLGRLSGSSKG